MSAAQDEFNSLVQGNKASSRGHPEDRDQSDSDSPASASADHTTAEDQYELSDADSDYADYHRTKKDTMVSRTAAYTVPSTLFEANTGPKGVIADAQSFERARKKSFRRTLLSAAGLDSNYRLFGLNNGDNNAAPQNKASSQGSSSPSDEDEEFMRHWRESRLQELQQRNQRRQSPSKRVYGSVDTVDAEGYLNAIERVSSDTIVVVCIYDPESPVSSQVEDALEVVARKQSTTRFIKLHHEIAEMSHIDAPALLVYKAGDVTCTIVDIAQQIPRGRGISSTTIENLLKQNRVF